MTTGFKLCRPCTIDEALGLAREHPGAAFVAGGTDLLVQLRKRRADRPTALISLRRIGELTAITRQDDGRLSIGAACTLTQIARDATVRDHYPVIEDAIRVLGSRQIRNVATVGGNLCNASPCANTAPALIVLDASVRLVGTDGSREVPIDQFFVDCAVNVLRPGELLECVLVPPPYPGSLGTYMRKGRVAMDLALAAVAVQLAVGDDGTCSHARVAAGSVAPIPLRLPRVEQRLVGSKLDDVATIAEARSIAQEDISPITDVRSTADYRRHIVGVYLERAIASCLGSQ